MASNKPASANHRPILLALITALSLLLSLSSVQWFRSIEWQLQDQLTTLRAGTQTPSDKILIIDIDDYSVNALSTMYGKWPWPRSLHAELLEFLNTGQPSAIAFDILFSEPDKYRPDADAYFNEVISATPNTFLAIASQETVGSHGTPLLTKYPAQLGLRMESGASINARKLLIVPNAIKKENWKVGSIDFIPNSDGIGRHYPIWHDFEGWKLISLPALIAQELGFTVPNKGSLRIDWQSNQTIAHQRISYAEVLANARGELDTLPLSLFKDRIILLGSTALGLHDFVSTPISVTYPGISVLANALDNLISGEAQTDVPLPLALALQCFLLLLAFVIAIKTNRVTATTTATLLALVLFCIAGALTFNGVTSPALAGVFALLSFALLCFLDLYFEKKRKLGDTIDLFSRFLDPKVVSELVEEGIGDGLLDTREVEVTVLFSDIRNFTTISEQRTAGEMVSLLNNYFDKQVDVLFKHKATLDKFIGDAVMAFWGAPLSHSEHPVLAIEAALDMMDQLALFKEEYGFKDLDIGIGIHTGHAVVGMIGARQRYDYTAIGDTVNLASRIEGLTKNCAHILVSEATMLIARDHFHFEDKGEFKVKGRTETVRVYEPSRKKGV